MSRWHFASATRSSAAICSLRPKMAEKIATRLSRVSKSTASPRFSPGDTAAESLDDISWQQATDLILVPHHGSKNSWDAALYDTRQPSLALISAGRNNRYGHPHAKTTDGLAALNIPTLCTADTGAVRIYAQNGALYYKTGPWKNTTEKISSVVFSLCCIFQIIAETHQHRSQLRPRRFALRRKRRCGCSSEQTFRVGPAHSILRPVADCRSIVKTAQVAARRGVHSLLRRKIAEQPPPAVRASPPRSAKMFLRSSHSRCLRLPPRPQPVRTSRLQ